MKFIGVFVGFFLSLQPLSAFAHATPVRYEPPASAMLEQAPARVAIRFSERPDRPATFIEVLDASGKRINDGGIEIDPSDARLVSVPFPANATGTFLVSWSVISADDGHQTSGAFGFSVGTGNVAPLASFDIVHRLDVGDGLATWLSLLGHALVVGVIAMMWVRRSWEKRCSLLACCGGLLVVAGEQWLMQATGMSMSTVAGKAMLLRSALGVAMIAAALLPVWKPKIVLLALFAFLFAIVRALVSHAAASELPAVSTSVNVVHLLAKDLWIGGVIASVFFIASEESERRLSKLIAIALGIGGLTGAYIVWQHLKSFDALAHSAWGGRTITLTVFALVLLLLRLAQESNKKVYLPVWRILEAVSGVFVLLASSFALITTPPIQPQQRFTAHAEAEGTRISLEEHPFEDDRLLLTFDPPVVSTVVTATDIGRGIGPLELAAEERFSGGFAMAKDALSGGQWKLDVVGRRESSYDVTASFELPSTALDTARELEGRSLPFTLTFVAVGLASAVFAFFLCRRRAMPMEMTAVSGRDAWLAAAFGMVLLSYMGFHFIHQPFNAFRKLCERNGNMWHDSVPTRDGLPVSAIAIPGCMTGMGLAQRHFADIREYRFYMRPAKAIASMSVQPATLVANQAATLTFVLRTPDGQPLTELVPEHDQLLHVIIIGQDMTEFQHLHADPKTLAVPVTFPKAGRYLIAIDYAVRSSPQSQQFYVTVGGSNPMGAPSSQITITSSGNGYTTTLQQKEYLTFDIQKNHEPVTNLTPYLAAPLHLIIVSQDLRKVLHTHGELPRSWLERTLHPRKEGVPLHMPLPRTFGSPINAYVTFPSSGIYHLFAEFMHEGRVQRAHFIVNAKQ